MTAATRGYWCECAVVGDIAERSVRVTVADGRFASVEPGTAAEPGDRRLPGLTIPGLANAHSHAFHRALRSRAQRDGGTFWTWRDVMYRTAARLDPDTYLALARATFAEMVTAGITSVGEFHYVHHQPDGTPYDDPNVMGSALAEAAEAAGLRMTLLDTLYLHAGLTDGRYAAVGGTQLRFTDGCVDAWLERIDVRKMPVTSRTGVAVHSVRAVDPGAIAEAARWAAEHGVPLHAHVSEQVAENEQCLAAHGMTPTGLLHESGALDASFTAVHATHLTDRDIALLGGATVCMCPTTERDLGDGIGPSPELVSAGAALAVGSDSHAVIDILQEVRAVELDERLRSMRRGVHRAEALLDAATVGGHRCLGWDDAGTITPGGRADLVTISLDSPRTAGADRSSLIETAAFAASAADITDVVVDGREVVVGGRHVRIDVGRELDDAITAVMGD